MPAEEPAAPADAPPTGPAAPKPADGPKAAAWAAFHREKKAFQAEREVWQAEKAKMEAEYGPIKSKLAAAKEDTIAAIEALGYKDPKEFLERLAQDGGRMTPERKQLLELQQWKADQEKRDADAKVQAERDRTTAEEKAAVDKLHSDIVDTIKNSPKYSKGLVSLPGGHLQAAQVMNELYEANGEVPDFETVLAETEKRFESNFKELLNNPRAVEFFENHQKSKLPQKPGAASQKKPMTTISGDMRAGTSTKAAEEYVPSRDGEKELAEALEILQQRGHKVRRG